MIGVVRSNDDSVPEHPGPDWLSKANGATEQAIIDGSSHEGDDAIYASDAVRAALVAMFHGKCAYCETRLSRGQWDVDHFRPKGRVHECANHPGYYWLCYKWSNLYPACEYCNRPRRERAYFDPRSSRRAGGKADRFPIRHDGVRAMDPTADINREHPLLLDPCSDAPADHFGVDITGRIFDSYEGDLQAEMSREIYNLNFQAIREDREGVIINMLDVILILGEAEVKGNTQTIIRATSFINRACDSKSEYAGTARYVVSHPEKFGISTI